jgi:hypothetical protein
LAIAALIMGAGVRSFSTGKPVIGRTTAPGKVAREQSAVTGSSISPSPAAPVVPSPSVSGPLADGKGNAMMTESDLPGLGQQGDFFGGHFTAVVGLVTIVLVGLSVLLERDESRRFALREAFLRGTDQIVKSLRRPQQEGAEGDNAEPTALTLRFVNYYARVALAHENDQELLIILNIPITGALRNKIEELAGNPNNNYPFAVEALKRFKEYEENMHLTRKGILRRQA